MSIPCETELLRTRYWQGQMLRALDFNDQGTTEAQLRWWHNRALHSAFGISMGLTASPVPQNGALIAVRVNCGVAYDCYGRPLILRASRQIAAPKTVGRKAEKMLLLLRYKEATPALTRSEASEVCILCCSSPSEEEPEFLWKPAGCAEEMDGIPVARVNYDNEIPAFDRMFVAPVSRPLARSRMAAGMTIAGQTSWELWSVNTVGPRGALMQRAIGVQTRVNTSAAGFTEMPSYFAWLQGSLWDQNNGQFVPALFPSIADVSTTGFTFRLLMPEIERHSVGVISGSATVTAVEGARVKVEESGARPFRVGDVVTYTPGSGKPEVPGEAGVLRTKIEKITKANWITLTEPLKDLRPQDTLRIADLSSGENTVRVTSTDGLERGDEIVISGHDIARPDVPLMEPGVIQSIAPGDFVTITYRPQRPVTFAVSPPKPPTIAITFNHNFSVEFYRLAQRRPLRVCWLACQMEQITPLVCPEHPGVLTPCT